MNLKMVLNRKQSENKWYTTEAAVTTATQNSCYRITLFGKCKWIAHNALQQSMILILEENGRCRECAVHVSQPQKKESRWKINLFSCVFISLLCLIIFYELDNNLCIVDIPFDQMIRHTYTAYNLRIVSHL